MEILFILGITLFLAAITSFINNGRVLGFTNFTGHLIITLFSLKIVRSIVIAKSPIAIGSFFYVDALSAFFILTVSMLNAAAALYSVNYMGKDLEEGTISLQRCRIRHLSVYLA